MKLVSAVEGHRLGTKGTTQPWLRVHKVMLSLVMFHKVMKDWKRHKDHQRTASNDLIVAFVLHLY